MNAIELAQHLVSFKTEIPEGDEEVCAEFLGDYVRDMHLDASEVELHRFSEKRANLIVRIGSSDEAGLMLSGHMDTVPAGDASSWSVDPFGGAIKNELLFGRGSTDMKGGLAALVESLKCLKGQKLNRNLLLIATVGEENGYIGLRKLIDDKKIFPRESKWGLIGEPTGLQVVRKHKGVTRIRITVHGKSAHSSSPKLGINAVENATRYIEEIKKYCEELSHESDPELGATTMPVTLIEGGIRGRYNVIPDSCEFFLNCRRIPSLSAEKITEDLQSIAKELTSSNKDFQAEVNIDFNSDALQIAKDSEFVRLAEHAVGEKSIAVPYATEAPLYTGFGIPTIVLGPGNIEQAHTVDEFISVKEIERAVSTYEKIIRSVCL
jgi:acetylornithine deacetylase ArgE